jgi:hypothetical protein
MIAQTACGSWAKLLKALLTDNTGPGVGEDSIAASYHSL